MLETHVKSASKTPPNHPKSNHQQRCTGHEYPISMAIALFIQAVRDHHINVQRKAEDAIHSAAHAVIDDLALEERHGGKVSANAGLDETHSPEEEMLVGEQG
jgi:hypothetical protein